MGIFDIFKNNTDDYKCLNRKDLSTDSGMLGIWDFSKFKHINDYDSWDAKLCEDKDILRHIKSGAFVPINLGDGVFAIDVRFGNNEDLSAREREYLLVPSKPYLLNVEDKVFVSGIERISGDMRNNFLEVKAPTGQYTVYVNLIDWNQEPGALDEAGKPTKNALPDVIVFLDSDSKTGDYRQELETFRKEDALR